MECPDCKAVVCFQCGDCTCTLKMEWIKCSDRLPEINQWVLGANIKRVEMGVWEGEKIGFTIPSCNYMCLQISHWMPLPEPPKE